LAPEPDFCVREPRPSKHPSHNEGPAAVLPSPRPGSSLAPARAHLTGDAWPLFSTRFVRLFVYGFLSLAPAFYLVGIGLSEPQTALLLTLAGDTWCRRF